MSPARHSTIRVKVWGRGSIGAKSQRVRRLGCRTHTLDCNYYWTKMVFPGERKPSPFHFAVRVSRADSQLTWTYTCRYWEWSMIIILPHGGQLQNYLKLDLGELVNHLWAHVESKSSKNNLPGNIRARMARNWTVLSIGRVAYHAFIHHFISSYAVLLSFFFG